MVTDKDGKLITKHQINAFSVNKNEKYDWYITDSQMVTKEELVQYKLTHDDYTLDMWMNDLLLSVLYKMNNEHQ